MPGGGGALRLGDQPRQGGVIGGEDRVVPADGQIVAQPLQALDLLQRVRVGEEGPDGASPLDGQEDRLHVVDLVSAGDRLGLWPGPPPALRVTTLTTAPR